MVFKKLLITSSFMVALGFTNANLVFAQTTTNYVVRPGDSLWKIAVQFQVGYPEILQANPNLKNPSLIYSGETIHIPVDPAKSIESQVVTLVNKERAANGLAPLTLNWQLSRMGEIKCQDMRDHNYFSHNSPTYGSPFQMMTEFGIPYTAAGENIAAGQVSAQDVMNSWMNSPGHRANILNSSYTQIGVGYAKGGSMGTYWSQEFIHP